MTLEEKIKYFDDNYVNELFQFNIEMGNNEFVVVTEWYDSTKAYKKYYALETKNGYSIYTIYEGYILFFIELSEIEDGGSQMHVNYYVKYSSFDPNKVVGSENLINSLLGSAFGNTLGLKEQRVNKEIDKIRNLLK